MMKPKRSNCGSILWQSCDGWQIAVATNDPAVWNAIGDGNLNTDQLAKAVAEFTVANGLFENVALLLDSKSTLVTRFKVENHAELRDRRVLSYRAEERLPVAAEDFTADYIHEGKEVLGIATPCRDLRPFLTALNEVGVHVQTISPTATTAVQSLLNKHGKLACDFVLWQDGDNLELFRVGQRITDWRHLPAETSAIVQQLAAIQLRSRTPLKVALLDVHQKLRDAVVALREIEVQTVDTTSLTEHARRNATSTLAGKSRPWFELRRDKLVVGDPHHALRREWQWVRRAVAVLLLSTAFFFGMRGMQYKSSVADVQDQQAALFQQVFPDSRVPSAVVSRLKSERTKLLGARGTDAAVVQPPSALNVLRELVAGMPAELRLQVEQLRVEDGKIYLDLNMRTVGDAGELADALEQRGFVVDPPTTEQFDAKEVSVRISGRIASRRRSLEGER